jgi:hypothetical protein
VITLPKLEWQTLTLEPEGTVTRGHERDDRSISELIALGGPVSIPVTAEHLVDEEDAAAFVRVREGSFSFFLVHLACAFRPLEDEPLLTATVRVDLVRGDGASSPRPIALSIKPLRLSEPVEVSRTIRLGASLKILQPGVEWEETRTFGDPFVEGLNELRSDPVWEFRRTRHTDIRGSQRLVLVVQSPMGSDARGSVALSATVARKRLGILSYAANLPGGNRLDFVLGQ